MKKLVRQLRILYSSSSDPLQLCLRPLVIRVYTNSACRRRIVSVAVWATEEASRFFWILVEFTHFLWISTVEHGVGHVWGPNPLVTSSFESGFRDPGFRDPVLKIYFTKLVFINLYKDFSSFLPLKQW